MPTKSHVDLCLFIQILSVEEDQIPLELAQALRTRDTKIIYDSLHELGLEGVRRDFVDHNTNLHESIHIAQGIVYPYMRWFAIATYYQFMQIFKEYGAKVNLKDAHSLDIHAPALHILDVQYYLWDMKEKLLFWTRKYDIGVSTDENLPQIKNKPLVAKVNCVDLLESAASLIQYKMSTSKDFPTWQEFDRWSKRNRSYTKVLKLCSIFLGDADLATRVFLPLVQVSFETNQPVRAFAILLGALRINLAKGLLKPFIEQKEPCRWIDLFDEFMNKIKFDEPDLGDLISKKFFRLDRYATSNMRLGGVLGHPVLGYFSRMWGEFEKRDAAFRYAFTAPNGYSQQIGEMIEIFGAPISFIKFIIGNQNYVLVSGDLNTTSFGALSNKVTDADRRGLLTDIIVIYSVVRRLSNSLMDSDFRFCHHRECPFFESNYCNLWLFIPSDYTKCGFPARFEHVKSYATREAQQQRKQSGTIETSEDERDP